MKKLVLILMTGFLIISCSSDNTDDHIVDPVDDFNIQSYHIAYVQFDFTIYAPNFPNYPDFLVKLEYDEQNRITRKIGGPRIYGATYDLYALTDSIYVDFEYIDNKIHLVKKALPISNISILENKTTLVFDNNEHIIQKIIYEENNNPQISDYDTINYSYNSNNKLINYVKTSTLVYPNTTISRRDIKESELYYSNNNLDSIITVTSTKYSDMPNVIYGLEETKRFGGYDSAQNPFRKLQFFDETFNRSLSDNNFTEYEETFAHYHYPNSDYSQTPTLVPSININTRGWGLAYDDNGEWIYDQF